MQELSQEYNYLDAYIDKTAFIDTLKSIFNNQLNEVDHESFAKTYDEIKLKNKQVTGRDLLAQAQMLKNKNSQRVLKQIEYFEDQIFKLQRQGLKCFPQNQFQKLFANPQEFRCLDKLISQRIMESKLVSLQKLLSLVTQLRKQFEQNNRIVISSKINLQKSKLAFKNHILKPINKLYSIAKQYIVDTMAHHYIDQAYQQLIKQQQNVYDNMTELKQNQKKLIQQLENLEDLYVQKCQIAQEYEQRIIELEQKNKRLISNNNELQDQLIQLKEQNKKIKYENDLIKQQRYEILDKLYKKNQEFENTSAFIRNQKQMIEKYEQFIRNTQIKEQQQIREANHKIFVQRTQKQKLEDANLRIGRLIEQKNNLQAKIIEMETANNLQIRDLQIKIQELQMRKLKDSKFKDLRFSNYRASKYLSRISQLKSQIKFEDKNGSESRQQKVDQKQVINQKDFKKKINKEIKMQQIESQSQKSQEQNQNIYDFLGLNKQKQGISQLYQIKSFMSYQPISKIIFSSQGAIVKDNGNHFEIHLLITSDMLIILDTKNREKNVYSFQQLSKLHFCHYNQNWILLKFKKDQKKKIYQNKDILISLYRRCQLQNYLSKYCRKIHKNVSFQKEEQTWIKIKNQDYLLSKFQDAYNPYNEVFSSNPCFLVSIQERGLFAIQYLAYESILVVVPLGMLFFFRESQNEIMKKQKLLYLLPLVQKMDIVEYVDEGEYKIKVIYQHYKKSFKIRVSSEAISKKIIYQIKKELQLKRTNIIKKIQLDKKMFQIQ